MTKSVVDDDLQRWEAFASTGPYGYSDRSVVVFRCSSNPDERPRAYPITGDKSDAEARVENANRVELLEMLAGAEPLQ
jgi:hypothetical protein